MNSSRFYPRLSVAIFAAVVCLVSAVAVEVPDFMSFQHYEEPVFPFSLASTSVSHGFATVAFVVGRDGTVEDAVALEANHPAFGRAVLEAMRKWQIAPPAADAPRHRELVQYLFTREHVITSLTQKDAAKAVFSPSQDDAKAVHFVDWKALNPPPERTVYVAPAYPAEARARRIQGSVTVNFVVDETGVVHVPTLTKPADPLLGAEVISAVKKWRFAPPTLHGQPVNVQVEREFTFLAKN